MPDPHPPLIPAAERESHTRASKRYRRPARTRHAAFALNPRPRRRRHRSGPRTEHRQHHLRPRQRRTLRRQRGHHHPQLHPRSPRRQRQHRQGEVRRRRRRALGRQIGVSPASAAHRSMYRAAVCFTPSLIGALQAAGPRARSCAPRFRRSRQRGSLPCYRFDNRTD